MRTFIHAAFRLGSLGVLALLAAGCTGASSKPAGAASGKVMRDGKPVASATVTFHEAGGVEVGVGSTDESGQFVLIASTEKGKLAPGEYIVTVKTEQTVDENTPESEVDEEGEGGQVKKNRKGKPKGDSVLAKYASPETSTLKAKVTDTGPNEFTFELK